MLKNAFGLIYTGESTLRLRDITSLRAIAAVPFGGRYRMIDFGLSNLVNTGITNVGIITQKNYHSLMDHLSNGGAWDLNRKRDGMFILPPYVTNENSGIYRGTVDALKNAKNYIDHAPYDYCIFMGAHTIYNATFDAPMSQHLETGADITFIYNVEPIDKNFVHEFENDEVRLKFDDRGRVIDMEINPYKPQSPNISMDCFIIKKSLLEYLIDEATSRGNVEFIKEVISKRLGTLKVYGYKYDGYVARMDTVSNYFKANMDLLKSDVRKDLFDSASPIYTKVKDQVPAIYKNGSSVKNCMVADGCIIEGEIENCILFRGVRVDKNAKIKNSIVMQDSEIHEDAYIENVILDKEVAIRRGRQLVGAPNFPVLIRKNAII